MWPIVWIALISLFLYPYLIYPALLYCLVRVLRKNPWTGREACPTVALVICAFNEQNVIGQKIENSLALEYPRERLRIFVISDGSTDRTASVVRQYADARIELIDRTVRRGKIANLNEWLPKRREEILVLSDANVMYRSDALTKLVRRFCDPGVGCVSGKVILTESAPELEGPTQNYYSLEWRLQEWASSICSMPGADGAMYALRRELFRPCPGDTLIEDFAIAMAIIRQGRRVIHEPEAVGWERGPESLKEEFRRRVRIAAGAAQGLIRGYVWPPLSAHASFWWIFVSHKLLRWLSPLVGLVILVCALAAMAQPAARVILAVLAGVSALALIRMLSGWKSRLVNVPFYFLFAQVALGFGLLRGLGGRQTILWAKANR
jgi:poly-beta-1,6-N-acetyl-D-glucosamine synthase